MRGAAALAAFFLLASCVTPGAHSGRTLTGFEQALGAQDSATAALTGWCARYHIASPAHIIARPAGGAAPGNQAEVRRVLAAGPDIRLGFRHVLLACGDTVLSDAYNWYVPARLTPAMNHTLETTHQPFGKVIASLQFRRQRLASREGAAAPCPAGTILSHRALLRLPDGQPISLVIECYTAANLGR